MLLPGNTANTQCPHRFHKEKVLCYAPMSATGNKFVELTFQIDTAATRNTLSEYTLLRLMPKMKLTKAPYLLYPYSNAQPLKPLGQINLLRERNRRYKTLTFQVLETSCWINQPFSLGPTVRHWGSSSSKQTKYSPPPFTQPARQIPAMHQAAQQRTPTAHPRKPQANIWTTPTRTNSTGNPQHPHRQNP